MMTRKMPKYLQRERVSPSYDDTKVLTWGIIGAVVLLIGSYTIDTYGDNAHAYSPRLPNTGEQPATDACPTRCGWVERAKHSEGSVSRYGITGRSGPR